MAEITKNYVYASALANGIDPEMAIWITRHESNFQTDVIGDTDKKCPKGINKGKTQRARGLWQINDCYWPKISDAFAFSISSSTEWAMKQIKKNPNIWSVWRFCHEWFSETCSF